MDFVLDRQVLISLLQKAYFERLSAEEERMLTEWREQSPEHELLYERIKSGKSIAELLEWQNEFDLEQAKQAIQCRIKEHHRFRMRKIYVQVAAVAILLLGIGAMWNILQEKNDPQLKEWTLSYIRPGVPKVILTLGDGRQVALDKNPIELKLSEKQLLTGDSAVLNYAAHLMSPPANDHIDNVLSQENKVEVPVGGEYQLVLADGTKVWINAESSLSYPVEFIGEQRRVVLQGEAYFEVASDPQKPFIVQTSTGMEIKVMGTHFNVEAYMDRKEWKTTLVEGSVEVKLGDQQALLHPNEQFSFNSETNQGILQKVNVREVIAWKNGWFVFDNTPLDEILETIRRWYDFEVEYQNSEIRELRFTGDLSKYDSFEAVIHMFEDTKKVRLEVNANRLIVKKR